MNTMRTRVNRTLLGDRALLGIYLNDHLAGATAGLELARRSARAHRGPAAEALRRLAVEIAEDREALLEMMITLRVPVRRYKIVGGWAAEKAGRAKLNGRLLGRSASSGVVELEGLRLGVQGKTLAWRTLRALADREPGLDAGRLDGLIERARRHADELDGLHADEVATVFAETAG